NRSWHGELRRWWRPQLCPDGGGRMGLTVGFEDSDQGRDALELGVALAQAFGRALTVATVFPGDDRGVLHAANDSQWLAAERSKAEAVLDLARKQLADRVQIEAITLGPGSAARLLYEYAEDSRPRALVL